MPDNNHRDTYLNAVAARIRSTISETGVCELCRSDLATLWEDDGLDDAQKRLCVQNFANHYQFLMVVDYGLELAVFR